MKKILLFLFVSLSTSCFAQFSKTHYIPPLTSQTTLVVGKDAPLVEDHYLYISTPNTADVTVKIIEIGGSTITKTVRNTTPIRHDIGVGNNTQLFTPKTTIGKISNKGYIIEAEDLVYVSVRVNAYRNGNGSYNHAGGLVSKGNSALGTVFRLGAMLNPLYDTSLLNFASVLATENNTEITISNIPLGTLFSDGTTFTGPIKVILDKDESYVLALENSNDGNPISNSSKMIGALVASKKPVVVNSGSIGGSNSSRLVLDPDRGILVPAGRDLGFDQIVDFEKTGTEYIFVKGLGTDEIERVLLIAQNPNTIVYLNGSTTPFGTPLNAGDFIAIDGSQFIDGNLYVTTSEKVFAYQSIGGLAPGFLPDGRPNSPPANQNLFFVPPLNCSTPNTVDNIPLIQSIGSTNFTGGLNIVTETGAEVKINGDPTTAVPVSLADNGKPDFVRYTINGLSGNVSVKSEKQVYVSYFGTNNNATYGGYYSGFDLKPEIVSDKITVANSSCIPNVVLKINTLSSYDVFKWYKNGVVIPLATLNSYTPTEPGYYKVEGSISACGTTISSDEIPVSYCPTDLDNDKANDNIDVDNDNDGILNCDESYGDRNIDVSDTSAGTITVDDYSNSFIGAIAPSGGGLPAGTVTGNTDGSFVTAIPAGKGNSVTYKMTFAQPISVGIEYVNSADPANLLNANAEYSINSDRDKTVTVLNPDNKLLIDTNYDGIYETDVKEHSSYEIRFRLNTAATGTFKFLSYLAKSISFTHKNLSETNPNKSTLKIFAVCVPKDSDSDGTADQLDADSDNDGIPDIVEAHGNNAVSLLNSDTDNNFLDDAFVLGFTPIDTDLDDIADYLDLDSDNDGILDSVETGTDLDGDGIPNYRDLDSDGDVCTDVIEARFPDADIDGKFGNSPIPPDPPNGLVPGAPYSPPHPDFLDYAPIVITTQPLVTPTCELENATISVVANIGNTFQWYLSIDNGTTWTVIVDDTTYAGALTNTLVLTSVTNTMNGNRYRVQLSKPGNFCGLPSEVTTLIVYSLPVITSPVSLIQCDDVDAAPDGIATFNLTQNNSFISATSAPEDFSYFTDPDAATSNDTTFLIPNPLTFISSSKSVWVRVRNSNDCFRVAQLDLTVSVTKLRNSFLIPNQHKCDDYLDTINNQYDGVASFDFTPIFNSVQAELIGPTADYSIKFYKNINDFNAETDSSGNSLAIGDITNYRNVDSRGQQTIWLRVESTLDNSCFGSKAFTVIVEPTPVFNTVGLNNIIRNCDDDQDGIFGFDTSTLGIDILQGQNNIDLTYFDDLGNQISPLPNPFLVNTTKTITVRMTNNPSLPLDGPCYYEEKITFIVDELPKNFVILITDMTDVNTITVNVNESGNYEYSLDEPSGYFQDSNFFTNVPAGIHTVYINDKNGCGFVLKTIAVVGVPKFFTPNGDGHNDYWSVQGVNATFNTKSIIYIFDRYGKLLKQCVPASNDGWDGTFNGAPLPADDYWYNLKLEDGREAKGHFSLKR